MPQYNSVTPEIIAELEKVVPGRVAVGADVNPDYARDEMPIYGTRMPEAAIDVLTTEEVAGIMKVCYEHGIPVTTRGAGTGLAGGCTPIHGGVVLCTMRMNKIRLRSGELCRHGAAGVLLSRDEDAPTPAHVSPDPARKWHAGHSPPTPRDAGGEIRCPGLVRP